MTHPLYLFSCLESNRGTRVDKPPSLTRSNHPLVSPRSRHMKFRELVFDPPESLINDSRLAQEESMSGPLDHNTTERLLVPNKATPSAPGKMVPPHLAVANTSSSCSRTSFSGSDRRKYEVVASVLPVVSVPANTTALHSLLTRHGAFSSGGRSEARICWMRFCCDSSWFPDFGILMDLEFALSSAWITMANCCYMEIS